MKMYIFIINPISGSGKALKVWDKIKQELEKKKVEYRSFFTKYPGHASEIAQQVAELHQDKLEAIVAVGGDGTIHEVFNGLTNYSALPVGYIPAGSGNDFARGFSIPLSPLKALQFLLKRKGKGGRKIDIGRYQFSNRKKESTKSFINGLGIGFDADVAKATNESRYKGWLNKIQLGRLAYFIMAIKLLFSYKTQEISVEVDGQSFVYSNVWLIAICNSPFLGGGMNIAPQAKVNDGKLHLCVLHDVSKWKLLALFATVFLGKHTRFKGVILHEGRHIEVTSSTSCTVHADGELIGTTPITVTVEKQNRKIC